MELTLVILLIAVFFTARMRAARRKAERRARCIRLSAKPAAPAAVTPIRAGAARYGWPMYRGRRA